MQIDENHFRGILEEMLSENTLSCRAVLGISEIRFTEKVETLAVTLGKPSTLKVNLNFVQQHCEGENDVKGVILHELLHILMRHTQRVAKMTPLMNLAMDAIINATIRRLTRGQLGRFFDKYYADEKGPGKLLRSRKFQEREYTDPDLNRMWKNVEYDQITFGDLHDWLQKYCEKSNTELLSPSRVFLGDHSDQEPNSDEPPGELKSALERAAKTVFRSKSNLESQQIRSAGQTSAAIAQWSQQFGAIFQKFTDINQRSRNPTKTTLPARLPILTPQDRRATLRSTWSPFLPFSDWNLEARRYEGTVNLYLDVSGSMFSCIDSVIAALLPFVNQLRKPFWAFSDHVQPALIENGRLSTETSGGTQIVPVIEHFLQSQATCAVIITDGITETIPIKLSNRIPKGSIAGIIMPGCHATPLIEAGIPCITLNKAGSPTLNDQGIAW
jgi:hypothetical protein